MYVQADLTAQIEESRRKGEGGERDKERASGHLCHCQKADVAQY